VAKQGVTASAPDQSIENSELSEMDGDAAVSGRRDVPVWIVTAPRLTLPWCFRAARSAGIYAPFCESCSDLAISI
jgi:hypothetical protein